MKRDAAANVQFNLAIVSSKILQITRMDHNNQLRQLYRRCSDAQPKFKKKQQRQTSLRQSKQLKLLSKPNYSLYILHRGCATMKLKSALLSVFTKTLLKSDIRQLERSRSRVPSQSELFYHVAVRKHLLCSITRTGSSNRKERACFSSSFSTKSIMAKKVRAMFLCQKIS